MKFSSTHAMLTPVPPPPPPPDEDCDCCDDELYEVECPLCGEEILLDDALFDEFGGLLDELVVVLGGEESPLELLDLVVDFDDGEQSAPFAGVFEEIAKQYTANDTQWSEKYQAASDTIASMNEEIGSLRQFKQDTENAALAVAREEVFAQFEDLIGVEEFDALRDQCAEYELDALEEKCFAIRGRRGTSAKFAHDSKPVKLKVEKTDYVNEPYGGLFVRYGHIDNN